MANNSTNKNISDYLARQRGYLARHGLARQDPTPHRQSHNPSRSHRHRAAQAEELEETFAPVHERSSGERERSVTPPPRRTRARRTNSNPQRVDPPPTITTTNGMRADGTNALDRARQATRNAGHALVHPLQARREHTRADGLHQRVTHGVHVPAEDSSDEDPSEAPASTTPSRPRMSPEEVNAILGPPRGSLANSARERRERAERQRYQQEEIYEREDRRTR